MRWLSLVIVFNLLSLNAVAQEKWWDKKWGYRRKITLRNVSDVKIKKGTLCKQEFDLKFLTDIKDNIKGDLSDIRVVYKNKQIPIIVEKTERYLTVIFAIQTDIQGYGSDDYFLYYSNPEAKKPDYDTKHMPFFFEDFYSKKLDKTKYGVKGKYELKNGLLVIKDVGVNSPFELKVLKPPTTETFYFEFEIHVKKEGGGWGEYGIKVEFEEVFQMTQELSQRVDNLIRQLGHDDFEIREKATKELIKIGRVALKKLEKAMQSEELEIKLRAKHIIAEINKKYHPPVIRMSMFNQRHGRYGRCVCQIGKITKDSYISFMFHKKHTIRVQKDKNNVFFHVNNMMIPLYFEADALKSVSGKNVKSITLFVKCNMNRFKEVEVDRISFGGNFVEIVSETDVAQKRPD